MMEDANSDSNHKEDSASHGNETDTKIDRKTFSGKPFEDVEYFVNEDNQYIFCRRWSPSGEPKAIMLLMHGFGEHCGRYEGIAQMLNQLGICVFSHDHVGHGESEGHRCDVTGYEVYIRDALQHVNIMKEKYPGLPIYLLGHSMGGALSVIFAQQQKDLFQNVVLSSPMIAKNPAFESSFKVFLAKHLSPYIPHLGVDTLPTSAISRDPDQVAKYINDPLVYHDKVALRMGYQVFRISDEAINVLPQVKFPFLVLHGDEDTLCDISGSKMLMDLAKSQDKTFKVYEGAYHELIHEIDDIPQRFLNDIKEWLQARMPE